MSDLSPSNSPLPSMTGPAQRFPWRILLLGILASAGALFIDQQLTDWMTAPNVRRAITRPFELLLASSIYLNILAILACYPNRGRLIVGFILPLLVSTALTHAAKWAIGRARPSNDIGPLHFDSFELEGRFHSFPSGHTTAAVTLATLLGIYFPQARGVFYFFAACVAFERILNDRHYLSDVLAGAVVGAFSVHICLKLLGRKFYSKRWPAQRQGLTDGEPDAEERHSLGGSEASTAERGAP